MARMDWGQRKKRKLLGEINVVPLIDVMLVLLVVFMITAPLITQGIKLDLPKVDSELMEDNDDLSLEVWVDAEGQYFVSLGVVAPENPEPVSLESIGESVRKIMDQNPGVPVFVNGDDAVNYGKVVELISILEAAGVSDISLITEPPEGGQ